MKKLIALSLLLILSSCEIQYGEFEPPPRPLSVPKSALWIGGPVGDGFIEISKGGVYVDISKTELQNIYMGTIYADVTGDTVYQGKFKYIGKDNFDVNDEKFILILGWGLLIFKE